MTVTSTHAYSARVVKTGGDIPLALRLDNPGAVELNASGIPHATGEVTVAVENAMLLEELDPRDNRRVIIEAKRADTWAPVYTPWVVQRRNIVPVTQPTVYAGSGWAGAGGVVTTPGWVSATINSPTTGSFFTDGAEAVIAVGDEVTMTVTYRVDALGTGTAATHVSVRPHRRTGNTYYTDAQEVRPIVVGQTETVTIQWTSTIAMAAGELDLAIVSAGPTGAFATVTGGFAWSATKILIERGHTEGSFFDGGSGVDELERARWLGVINSSTSVLETRSIDRTEPVYGPPRVFNLGIREAIPNRAEGTVALRLASDEALLGDFAQLADDKNPRTYQASLRGVCNYVLGKIGAVLQAGTTDADVTPYWGITNLVTNPSLEVNADGYTAGTNANSPQRVAVTFDPPSGFGIRWNTGGIGISYLDYAAASGIRVTAGRWYVLSGYMICSHASTGHGRVHFKNDEGVTIAQAVGASIGVTGSAWARPFVIAQAPAGATTVSIHFGYQATAANRQPHVDAVMFYEGNEVVPYFDGATGDTAFYDYSWSAAAHASASSRRAIVERLPESLVWRAGVSGMAFLETLLKAAGLRLVCDERRRWTLRDADYRGTGNQTYRHAANIETADETLSREDDAWFDAAVYEYSWTDQSGIDQRRVDAFALTGTPTKVLRVELPNTPFPGPGRAESIVRRAQGRGRTVTVSAIPTWTEQTDESLSVLLEGSPIQTGITGSVRFDFGGDTVTVTSRTTDTPAAAWILIPAGQKWNASPVGGTWTGEAI